MEDKMKDSYYIGTTTQLYASHYKAIHVTARRTKYQWKLRTSICSKNDTNISLARVELNE